MSSDVTIDRLGASDPADPTGSDPSSGGPTLHEPRWWGLVRDQASAPPQEAPAEVESGPTGVFVPPAVEPDAGRTQFIAAIGAVESEASPVTPAPGDARSAREQAAPAPGNDEAAVEQAVPAPEDTPATREQAVPAPETTPATREQAAPASDHDETTREQPVPEPVPVPASHGVDAARERVVPEVGGEAAPEQVAPIVGDVAAQSREFAAPTHGVEPGPEWFLAAKPVADVAEPIPAPPPRPTEPPASAPESSGGVPQSQWSAADTGETYAPLSRAMDPAAEHRPMPVGAWSTPEPSGDAEPEPRSDVKPALTLPISEPEPEPGPAPEPESTEAFGWDFQQASTEPHEWFPAPKRRPRWVIFVLAGLVVLVIVSVGVIVLAARKEKPVAAAPTAPPAPATMMAPDAAAPYRPQGVSVKSFEGRLLVSWKVPERTDLIVGYLVVAQSREGAVQKTEVPRAGELTAVLAGPEVGLNSCVVVTTLVSGEPSMMMSRSDPVCPRPVPTRSGGPATGGSATPNQSGGSNG
ncbi:hypothetical protein [Embleya sp. NPDC059237]|uniref:hypothetical protein n=1 Tax=Embleya sp. NPDC059237 TaxID=3346784 RepID=UPI003684E869